MLRQTGCLLFLGCLLLHGWSVGESPTWSEKFMTERAKALGPVRRQSTQEVNQFLLFEGHDVRRSGALRARPVDAAQGSSPAEAPEVAAPGPDNPRPKARRRRKRKKSPASAAPSAVPMEALLEKSRQAYASGRLDEARRYYSLVQRADPASTEASERLEEIRKELE